MSELLVRGAASAMMRSLIETGPGRPVLAFEVTSDKGDLDRALVARRVTKGVLVFRRARLDLHALEALRANRHLRFSDIEAVTSMHDEEEIEGTRDLHEAVDATLKALDRTPLPAHGKSEKLGGASIVTVTAFGASSTDRLSRSWAEERADGVDPALVHAVAPLLQCLHYTSAS